jgi:hypothetical protein
MIQRASADGVDGLVQLLVFNMEETLEPTLCWLQEKLNLGDNGIVQLVQKESSFLGFSLESRHKERISWLQKRLALDDESLSKLVKLNKPGRIAGQLPTIVQIDVLVSNIPQTQCNHCLRRLSNEILGEYHN